MKNFKISSVTPQPADMYYILSFSYNTGFFKKKTVTKELLIRIVDNRNIDVVGGGTFTKKEKQQIFVAIAKQQ